MKNLSFKNLHFNRRIFMTQNSDKDHVVINGIRPILLSAPHGVSQVRLGKYKAKEIGSVTTALYLAKLNDTYLIAKTQNNNDDANWDENSKYKNTIIDLINNKKIKYLIDIHGLSSKRKEDINLGIHLGKNIENNVDAFNNLQNLLNNNGFLVSIDQPFMAGRRTISGGMKYDFNKLWTIQIEINCAITNKKENFEKYKKLLMVLSTWLESLQ